MTARSIQPDIVARRIGTEKQPIITVDGFHPDPDGLRAVAVARIFAPARHHYPGIRADLPPDYFAQVRAALTTVFREVFGHADGIDLIDASFSIVTTPPGQLTIEQSLPHVDAVEPGRIALVHYLSLDGGDGTAFFRHRATGFETIDCDRSRKYLATLNAELRDGGPPPSAYIRDSNPQFEQIGNVEARYNRAVIYRSAMLHSGAISADAPLDVDPARGRLTVSAFLSAG